MNTALVGCGYWGPNILRNLNSISQLKVVVDVNEDSFAKLKEKYPHVLFSTTLDTIHSSSIEAVAIATPPNTHRELIEKLSSYHLFVEKPLADTVSDTEAILNIENKEKVNCVGHVFLFSPEIRKLKALIQEQSVQTINITRLNFGKYQTCGVEVDLLPHDLSILRYLLDSELHVKQACYGKLNGINTSGCAVVSAGNIDCVITSSWTNTSKVRCVTVTTKNGTFEYDMALPNVIKHYKNRALEQNIAGQLEHIEVEFGDEPLLGELKYWLDLIKNPTKNMISFKDGHEVVKLINDVRKVNIL